MIKPNNTPDIIRFTIPDLKMRAEEQGVPVAGQLFHDFLIAKTDSGMDSFQFPCRIDAIIIGICTAGESKFLSDLKEFTLTKGSMFICTPQNILQVCSAHDFRSDVLVISPDFMRQIHINTQYLMPVLIAFGQQRFFPLTDIDHMALHNLILQIETETQIASGTHFTTEIISGLISATIYKIGDILTRRIEFQPQHEYPGRNRAETYFRQFIQLLGEYYKTDRSVGFYARKMCITPKYLTTLIKRISNKSVSEWIDEYVVMEAKALLKYSDMSVQEIAYHLNFPNQSFFGSYFKRNTGMSPSQYKQA